jgi:hypothetical protein
MPGVTKEDYMSSVLGGLLAKKSRKAVRMIFSHFKAIFVFLSL